MNTLLLLVLVWRLLPDGTVVPLKDPSFDRSALHVIVYDDPTTEGQCSNRQWDRCVAGCNKLKKLAVACESQIEWQDDGSTKRTVICTCATSWTGGPGVNGSRLAETTDIEVANEN